MKGSVWVQGDATQGGLTSHYTWQPGFAVKPLGCHPALVPPLSVLAS